MNLALVGNPNSGKTTLFNALTGSNQHVGNWPGVTVEKKEGKLKKHKEVSLTDLPGVYSLSPYTLEEVITRDFLIDSKPDVIINIIDATNLERNLYLTTQILELGIPTVIALNMMDVVEKNKDKIDVERLSRELTCPVIPISAQKGTGVDKLIEAVTGTVAAPNWKLPLEAEVEKAVAAIETQLEGSNYDKKYNKRWLAVKILERDEKIHIDRAPFETLVSDFEKATDDDGQGIITSARYHYLDQNISSVCKKAKVGQLSVSDKIDRVVTNRFLALPIFAVVMFLVYFISITTIGTMATDWVNDGVFGDGFFLFGMGRGAYEESVGEFEIEQAKIDAFLETAEEEGLDTQAVSEALEFDAGAFEDEAEGQAAQQEADDAIDDFVTQAAAINAQAEIENEDGEVEETLPVSVDDFEAALEAQEPDPAEFGSWVPGLPILLGNALEAASTPEWMNSLILDGILAGVGAVLGFLPQMLVLFLCLAILEDCGYMARIAFIMDKFFRKFGLSGKSFIPMLISTGCGVPGIMASRTIENESDRRMTVMTTTFVPCGAKLPIIALIAGALFGDAAWVATSAYFVGVAAIIVSGIMLKKTRMFAGDPAPFIMELPAYHLPRVKGVLRSTFSRGWAFVKKAGTIILLSSIAIWFLSTFSWSMQMVEANESMLASIGNAIAPIFSPLGWGDWRSTVATINGLVAKENVVGTFGILYGFAEVAENGVEYWSLLQASFTQLSAYSFLLFNLLCAPCFAAIGAMHRELGTAKWTLFAVGYQCAFAYAIALIVYQLGLLFTGGGFGIGTVVAVAALALIVFMLLRRPSSQKPTPGPRSETVKVGK